MTSGFPTTAEFASFPPPNYVDPVTQRPLALGILIPMTVLVTTFISCRFHSRTVLVNTLGWDDWVMLLAAILSVGCNIMVIISMLPMNQMGYHLWDIKPAILYGKITAAKMGLATQLLFTVIVTLMKVAILFTYLRIFPSRLNKWFCRIMLAYTITLGLVAFFITLFQCTPVSTYWEIFKYIGTAKCLNIRAVYYFHSAQNTLSDLIIFLWPAKDLLSVQISLRQRVILTCMFSLEVIVCIAGNLRIYYTSLYLESYDVFWYGVITSIVMSVESAVGVACGCLPGCKPFMAHMFPRVFVTSTQQNSYPRRCPQQGRLRHLQTVSSSRESGAIERDAYPLRSLAEDETGFCYPVATAERYHGKVDSHTTFVIAAGTASTLSEQCGWQCERAQLDSMSDTSSDIILQRGSTHRKSIG